MSSAEVSSGPPPALNGVYRGAVSKKFLQSYVDEYAFHYNYRTAMGDPDPFRVLLARAVAAAE